MLCLSCGAASASTGIVVYLTMEKLNFSTFRIAKKGIMGFQISFALTARGRTVEKNEIRLSRRRNCNRTELGTAELQRVLLQSSAVRVLPIAVRALPDDWEQDGNHVDLQKGR
jgi:hypothetical protein